MQQLTPSDLNFVLTRTPRDVIAMMKKSPNLVFLAGGFIRATIAGEKPSDIDLFGPTKSFCEAQANALGVQRKARVHKTDNAITVLAPPRIPVQFITRWTFNSPQELVLSFDYTVCQAVIWAEQIAAEWKDKEETIIRFRSLISDSFYPDLAARRLVYTAPKRIEEAGGSLLRAIKFTKKGYSIQAPSLAAVCARLCSGVEWGKVATEKEAAVIMTALLRQVDPLFIIDGVEFIDEHEVIQKEG